METEKYKDHNTQKHETKRITIIVRTKQRKTKYKQTNDNNKTFEQTSVSISIRSQY